MEKLTVNVVILIMATAFWLFSDGRSAAKKVLERSEYKDYVLKHSQVPLSGCEEYWYNTSFTSRVNDRIAHGVVCCALITNACSIRIYQ